MAMTRLIAALAVAGVVITQPEPGVYKKIEIPEGCYLTTERWSEPEDPAHPNTPWRLVCDVPGEAGAPRDT